LDDHIRRLNVSAKLILLRLTVSEAEAKDAVIETLRRNQVHHDVYVRPMVFSNSVQLAPVLREEDSSFVIYTMPLKKYIDKESISVCVSSWRRASDNAIPARAKPTGLYLNSALARREAFDNGFDEALFLTERGYVSEGSAEHIIIVRDGALLAPPSTDANLDGITRRSLITLATEDLGLRFVERPISRSELYVAEEIFLCGTGAEVTPVGSVDRRIIGNGGVGPLTEHIKKQFQDVVRGRVSHRMNWLTPLWK